MVPVIEDDNCVNFDCVHVWYDPVGNRSWGPKGRRRNVLTVVKEKDRITTVLEISKSGRKLPLLFF